MDLFKSPRFRNLFNFNKPFFFKRSRGFSTAVRDVKGKKQFVREVARPKDDGTVPDVLLQLGMRYNKLCFISHPGVMMVSKLLEMPGLAVHQAVFSQENIDAIREFDSDLADKCQTAFDNKLKINMVTLEHINDDGFLEKLVRERDDLREIEKEVLSIPPGGPYKLSKKFENFMYVEVDRNILPQYEIAPEAFEVQPGLRQLVELRGIVRSFIESTSPWEPTTYVESNDPGTKQLPSHP